MNNVKKCFVLLFALSLSFAPLAICWYLPLNTSFHILAIFYYIFHDSPVKEAGKGSDAVFFDSESIMEHEMPLMKIMGFLYAAMLILLLIEFLIQIIKKKNLDKTIKITGILFLVITVLQFVNAAFYWQIDGFRFDKGSEAEWTCIWEINLVEVLIAVGFNISLYKKENKMIKNSRRTLCGHAIYSALLLTAIQTTCFACVRYDVENGDRLHFRNIFLEYNNTDISTVINGRFSEAELIHILPMILVAGVIMIIIIMTKEIREQLAYMLGVILNILTVLLFCQIIYVCVYLNQSWLIFPDLPMVLLLGWGSCRFLKVLPKKEESEKIKN